jgi:N-carbamoyl-L-amino-acid hydrolase
MFIRVLLIAFIPMFFHPYTEANQTQILRVDPTRLEQKIEKLAEFGKTPEGGVNRVAFSEKDIQSREYILSLMKEVGLKIHIDEAGNIIGRREGTDPSLPPIVFGSHTDTVPHGGKFDGTVGVLGAIECVQVLAENSVKTRHPLEVIVFTDEEGGLIGSKAIIGTLTSEALEVKSHSGKTVREGIKALGGDSDALERALKKKGDIKAFIEIHIEQGSTLASKGIDIGVVEGIVGINWWDVTIEGFANHAGTTPMDRRQDALLAAAHLIIAVNKVATGVPGRQVGTVGRIRAEPGAPNVIPGEVVMSLELRDLSAEKINSLFQQIIEESEIIAKNTGTKISFDPIEATAVPSPTDPTVKKIIADAAEDLGLSYLFMPSGAGHDAQNMAKIAPTGMIFVPSVGGVSHSPKEFTDAMDIANGANVLLHSILKIDQTTVSDKKESVEEWEKKTFLKQPPKKVMDTAGIEQDMIIGEVGAGRGRFTVHLARRVGPKGKILANDIDPDALDYLRKRCKQADIKNVETILGEETDPLFPQKSLDMVFMVWTYHFLNRPVALLKNLPQSLKPGGTVVLVEPDPESGPGGPNHGISSERMRREAEQAGFELLRIETFLPEDIIFILRLKKH